MILNKSLVLYIDHFDSINKNFSNKECFYLNRRTKLQPITETKQNKTMELLTPAMIYCLTLFQELNRPLFVTFTIEGEAQLRKTKPVSTCAIKSLITENNKKLDPGRLIFVQEFSLIFVSEIAIISC